MKYWYGGAKTFRTVDGFERAAKSIRSNHKPHYFAIHERGAENRDKQVVLDGDLNGAQKEVSSLLRRGVTFMLVPIMPVAFEVRA